MPETPASPSWKAKHIAARDRPTLERRFQAASEELARSREVPPGGSGPRGTQTRHNMLLAAGDSDRQVLTREQEKVVNELLSTRSELERLRNESRGAKAPGRHRQHPHRAAGKRIAIPEGKVESLQQKEQAARQEVQRCQQTRREAEASLAEQTRRSSCSIGEEDRQAWNREREQLESELTSSMAEAERLEQMPIARIADRNQ